MFCEVVPDRGLRGSESGAVVTSGMAGSAWALEPNLNAVASSKKEVLQVCQCVLITLIAWIILTIPEYSYFAAFI